MAITISCNNLLELAGTLGIFESLIAKFDHVSIELDKKRKLLSQDKKSSLGKIIFFNV